jgi:hypothetical protein
MTVGQGEGENFRLLAALADKNRAVLIGLTHDLVPSAELS